MDLFGDQGGEKFILVIAGANGSGKTTLGEKLVETGQLELFLNPDELVEATELADPVAAVGAGRLYIRQREELIRQGKSFGIETTLSGKSMLSLLRRVKGEDYTVYLAYCFVDSAELCVDRIAVRVMAGGHDVPEELVSRRFPVSMANFWHSYRFLADQWTVFYNGGRSPAAVVEGQHGECRVLDERLFHVFEERVP